MPEWLIERGIGETRFARIEDGEIVEARVLLDGTVPFATVLPARLTSIGRNGRNAIATDEQGREYLLPQSPGGITEGAALLVEVTRESIPGAEPWKRPLARAAIGRASAAPQFDGDDLPFPAPRDRLDGWSDLLEEARSGVVRFEGGELRVSPTPAMTLIDVDGYLAPFELAIEGARAAAATILRHGIGGSIGLDLPTVGGRAQRQEIGFVVDSILSQPFERTAVNGFGFLQIVRPRAHASLFELAQDRAAFEARALLRQVAMERSGNTTIVAHPAVVRLLESRLDWLDSLARQVGGAIALRAEPSLPISGAYAQGS